MIKTNTKAVNRLITILTIILNSFCAIGYIKAIFTGNNLSTALNITIVIAVITLAVALVVMYIKDNENKNIKYVSFIGHFIIDTTILFADTNFLIFMYLVIVATMYIMYFDYKIMLFIAIALGSANLLNVLYKLFIVGIPFNNDMIIVSFSAFMCINSTMRSFKTCNKLLYRISRNYKK